MSVAYQDYYKTLGVDRNSSGDQIQKAYRAQARKFHPDVNKAKDAEERFKKLSEAYEVLKDPERRSQYDALGENWRAGQEFRPPPGWNQQQRRSSTMGETHVNFEDIGGFSDFFSSLFGAGPTGATRFGSGFQGQQQATDLQATLHLSVEELYRGGVKSVTLEVSGERTLPTKRTFTVKIPPATRDGSIIRLPKASGTGGDILLKIEVLPHSNLRIDGSDLIVNLPVTPWEAALGAKVDAHVIESDVRVTIPAGSSTGKKLRLRGKGLPLQSGERGDAYLDIRVEVPKELSQDEKELFEKLAKISSFKPREE